MTPSTAPTFIEVCAGCGGLSTGFINAGFTPLLINELDKTCCDSLRKNHPGAPILQESMTALELTSFRGRVDVLMGGIPCLAFSQAGERRGLDDPRGQLMVSFNTLVLQCLPKMILVENVKGLISHQQGETLASLLALFQNGGLYTLTHRVLNAVDYGVPQKRERVIIVGVRSDLGRAFVYPSPNAPSQRRVLRDVLHNVPPSACAKYPESKREVMARVPQGGCWIDLPEDIQRAYMGERSLAAGGGKRGIARRLAMDEPSLTLTTSPAQKQTERCHPTETRPLSVREYARIQTFPDSYTFSGSMAQQYKQIGNAVPVKLAEAIALSAKQWIDSLN
jgi:DNA (cytosine-5)-methyltransferase 1